MRILSFISGSQDRGKPLGGGATRVFGFEGQRGLSAGAPQEWGKQKSTLGSPTQGFKCTGTREKQWFYRS